MPNPPLFLSQNWYDTVKQNPTYVVSNPDGDDTPNNEAWRVADNCRNLTWWTPTTTNAARKLRVTGLAAGTAPTMLILDRGHNLAGVVGVKLQSSTDNFATVTTDELTVTIPSVAGGLPTDANGCVTTGGVWVKELTGLNARTAWQLAIPAMGAGLAPIVTGLYLGVYYRWPSYCFPDAVSAWDFRSRTTFTTNVVSRRGVRVKTSPVQFGELRVKLAMEGADYAGFNVEAQRIFGADTPVWVCQDDTDATASGQTRLFQLQGEATYDPIPSPLHREIDFTLEEVIPTVSY
jgi:hypothetical protein